MKFYWTNIKFDAPYFLSRLLRDKIVSNCVTKFDCYKVKRLSYKFVTEELQYIIANEERLKQSLLNNEIVTFRKIGICSEKLTRNHSHQYSQNYRSCQIHHLQIQKDHQIFLR